MDIYIYRWFQFVGHLQRAIRDWLDERGLPTSFIRAFCPLSYTSDSAEQARNFTLDTPRRARVCTMVGRRGKRNDLNFESEEQTPRITGRNCPMNRQTWQQRASASKFIINLTAPTVVGYSGIYCTFVATKYLAFLPFFFLNLHCQVNTRKALMSLNIDSGLKIHRIREIIAVGPLKAARKYAGCN